MSFPLQSDSWKVGEELGSGASAYVSAVTNSRFNDIVVKVGAENRIEPEAELLWRLDHLNIVRLYLMLHTEELQNFDEPVGYMVLQRLGPSLQEAYDADQP